MSPVLANLRLWLFTGPAIVLATAFLGSVSLAVSLFDASGRAQHRVARTLARLLLRIGGVRLEVEGAGNIEPGGSFVFVANHRSYYDVPCLLAAIPVQLRFLADHNLFHVPFIGYHLKRAGHLPVNDTNVRQSLKSLAAASRIVQERGISILIFPEGERTHGEMLPFKDGAAYIAIKAGVPVVPVALLGTRAILPRGSLRVRSGRVEIRVGRPVPTLDLPLDARGRLSAFLRESILEMLRPPAAVRDG